MSQTVDFSANADDVRPKKSEPQFAQAGNPNDTGATRQSAGLSAAQGIDDRTLIMLQAFEGRV